MAADLGATVSQGQSVGLDEPVVLPETTHAIEVRQVSEENQVDKSSGVTGDEEIGNAPRGKKKKTDSGRHRLATTVLTTYQKTSLGLRMPALSSTPESSAPMAPEALWGLTGKNPIKKGSPRGAGSWGSSGSDSSACRIGQRWSHTRRLALQAYMVVWM